MMAKTKTTVYIDENLLKATKIAAVRRGKKEYEVFEEALREHLGIAAVENVWTRSDLEPEDALALAYDEVHASREG